MKAQVSNPHQHRAHYLRSLTVVLAVLFIFGAGMAAGAATFSADGSRFNTIGQLSANITNASLSNFWRVWQLLEEKYPFSEKPTAQEKIYGAIDGLVQSYNDPYTVFFPPAESKLFSQDVKGEFGGVGMEVGIREGLVVVITPLKGSPAERADIRAGDVILAIDQETTEGMSVDRAVSLIRGEPDTTITLTLIRDGVAKEFTKTLTREVIKVPALQTKIDRDAFVIEFYSFSENSAALVETALKEFNASKQKYLVLDLRNNPGGYLDAATDIASFFLPQGKVIVRESFGADRKETVFRSRGTSVISRPYEMAVLVNRGSASASEILAGALGEAGKAILVGEPTYGKGSVQELIELSDGSSVKITIAEWMTPNGVSISKEGLKPQFQVSDDETTPDDEIFLKAMSELKR